MKKYFTRAEVILALIIFILRIPFIGTPPMWDGHQYFHNLVLAVRMTPFNFLSYNLEGHNTAGYFFIHGLFQLLNVGNYHLFHIVNILFVIIASIMFFRIFKWFTKNTLGDIEALLATLIFAQEPLLVAASINPNPDFAVLMFFIATFYSLLFSRKWSAIIFGFLLCFSKEVGVALYLALVCSWFVLFELKSEKKIKNISQYSLPILSVALFFLHKKLTQGSAFFRGFDSNRTVQGLINFTIDNRLKTKLIQIFIFDFHWLLWLPVLLFLVFGLYYLIKNCKHGITLNNKFFLTFMVLFISFFASTYMTIQYRDWSTPRYIAQTLFFSSLFGVLAIVWLLKNFQLRVFSYVIIIICFLLQTYMSIDPVGNWAYGTFNFGKHKMMKIAGYTLEGACGGIAGRDQIVYNMQYRMTDKIVAKIFKDRVFNESSTLFTFFDNFYFEKAPFDTVEYKRTYKDPPYIYPPALTYIYTNYPNPAHFDNLFLKTEKDKRHKVAYYINFPWCETEENELTVIKRYYNEVADPIIVNVDNYELKVYKLNLKDEWK